MSKKSTERVRGLYVFVPAYNEEDTLAKVLQDLVTLKESGLVHGILVINDGSTDKTKEIAESFRSEGVEVINHTKNMGKGFCFYEGALWAKRNNAKFLGMFDADLPEIPKKEVEKMLRPLKDPKVDMVIGEVFFYTRIGLIKDFASLSGQRIIRMRALKPLFIGNKTWLNLIAGIVKERLKDRVEVKLERCGYGLEIELNYLIARRKTHKGADLKSSPNVVLVETNFYAPQSKRKRVKMPMELQRVCSIIKKRLRQAERIKEQRKTRKIPSHTEALNHALKRTHKPR
ncbi:MAG: glycosyltransferase family 2 protein [Candidatus Diapherotrites archaeon]|nr:glycosyltransferase family 2 protein [Candidatus Diapherotrites archaeon]